MRACIPPEISPHSGRDGGGREGAGREKEVGWDSALPCTRYRILRPIGPVAFIRTAKPLLLSPSLCQVTPSRAYCYSRRRQSSLPAAAAGRRGRPARTRASPAREEGTGGRGAQGSEAGRAGVAKGSEKEGRMPSAMPHLPCPSPMPSVSRKPLFASPFKTRVLPGPPPPVHPPCIAEQIA